MKSKSGRTIFHIAVTAAGLLFCLILSLHLYLKLNSTKIFTSYLEKLLNKKGEIYRIKHNSIDFDLLGGQLIMKNLQISFDEEQLKNSGLDSSLFFNASIPLLSIRGISISDFILFRKISADRVLLKNGVLKLYLTGGKGKTGVKPGKLPAFYLGNLIIEDTDVEFFTKTSELPKSGIKGIDLDTGKLSFDPGKKNFIRNAPAFHFKAKKTFMEFRKSGYRVDTGAVRFGSGGSTIRIRDINYTPLSPEITNRKKEEEGKLHQFSIPEISLQQIDIEELKEQKRLKAGQLYIQRPRIFLYRNRNIENLRGKKVKELPQQIFRQSPLKADIGLIRIKKGEVKYTEIARGERLGESLLFNTLNISFYNVSNFPEVIRDGRESEITVSTKIMDKSLLNGKIRIPVNNLSGRFFFSGSLGETNPAIFNRFLKRNVKIRIDRGKLNYMSFRVNADRDRAEGTMKMSYTNAHITVMKKKNPSKKSRFGTFLANTITHKNNPTRPGRKLRTGRIRFDRKEKRSILNYMWKCILTGIKSSIKI